MKALHLHRLHPHRHPHLHLHPILFSLFNRLFLLCRSLPFLSLHWSTRLSKSCCSWLQYLRSCRREWWHHVNRNSIDEDLDPGIMTSRPWLLTSGDMIVFTTLFFRTVVVLLYTSEWFTSFESTRNRRLTSMRRVTHEDARDNVPQWRQLTSRKWWENTNCYYPIA